jgi:hypothetical protein
MVDNAVVQIFSPELMARRWIANLLGSFLASCGFHPARSKPQQP